MRKRTGDPPTPVPRGAAVPATASSPPSASVPTSAHRWLVLIAMTGSLSMIMLDQTVVTVALPSMSHDLPLSPTGEQWVVNAYVLAMAALVALGGKLGDRLGGVTTFRYGVAIFFLASLACGLVPHGDFGEPSIIAARAVQGGGAALMVPVSAAIVVSAFSTNDRGRAMAVYAGISQVFLAVGPLLGGVLTESISWRTVFWLNVPVGLAALVMVHVARPDNQRRSDTQVSTGSAAMLVVGIGAIVLAVQQAGVWSWDGPATLLTLAGGIAVTAVFVLVQLSTSDALVNVRLLTRRAFVGNLTVLGLVQFALLAVVLYSSLYFQELLNLSPIRAGVAVLPFVLALAASAQLGGLWYDSRGVRPPALTGLAVCALGLASWALVLPRFDYVAQIPGMAASGFGIGLLMSPTNTDALGRVGAAERSQASGLVQTVRQLGGTLGVALIGAVVLGTRHHGAHASARHHYADAIAVGFGCAATVFAIALVAGWLLLPRDRLIAGGDDAELPTVAAA